MLVVITSPLAHCQTGAANSPLQARAPIAPAAWQKTGVGLFRLTRSLRIACGRENAFAEVHRSGHSIEAAPCEQYRHSLAIFQHSIDAMTDILA
jgi:hypothetical protein